MNNPPNKYKRSGSSLLSRDVPRVINQNRTEMKKIFLTLAMVLTMFLASCNFGGNAEPEQEQTVIDTVEQVVDTTDYTCEEVSTDTVTEVLVDTTVAE